LIISKDGDDLFPAILGGSTGILYQVHVMDIWILTIFILFSFIFLILLLFFFILFSWKDNEEGT